MKENNIHQFEIKGLKAGYSIDNFILKGIDLKINRGEVIGITGLNGSGKSTLAKAIMNKIPFRTGIIMADGIDIMNIKTHELINFNISWYIQGGLVFPNMTTLENLKFAGLGCENFNLVNELNTLTGLFSSHELRAKSSLLSGGKRNLLALMMIVIRKPKYIILDEPTAGLSVSFINKIAEFIKNIVAKFNCGIIIIEQKKSIVSELTKYNFLLSNGFLTKI